MHSNGLMPRTCGHPQGEESACQVSDANCFCLHSASFRSRTYHVDYRGLTPL